MKMVSAEEKLQVFCLFILTLVAIAFALYWLRPAMIPFILALFFSLMLTPLIDGLTRHLRFPKALALLTTLTLGILMLVILSLVITSSINQIAQSTAQYQQKIEVFLNKILAWIHLEQFGLDINNLAGPFFQNFGKLAGSMISKVVNAVLGILSQGFLVLIFIMFLLLGRTHSNRIRNEGWVEGERKIKRYIVTKFFTSAVTGILVGVALTFLGIDMATLFGLFAFILNFIPSIGSIIATLLPLPVVLASPDIALGTGIMAIAIPGAIQFVIGNIIEPKIIGDMLELHPATVLLALIFWGMIWGIVGMFLAVPLTVVMQIILSRIEFTKPVANILAGRFSRK
jgi:AI-2 transport protein TqsA